MTKTLYLTLCAMLLGMITRAQPTHLIAYAYYQWDYLSNQQVAQDSSHYSYSNGRPGRKDPVHDSEHLLYDVEETFAGNNNQWHRLYDNRKTYDANNNTLNYSRFGWNNAKQSWDTMFEYTYTYTAGNDTADFTYSNWPAGNRVLQTRQTRTYTAGKLSCISSENWDASLSVWEPVGRTFSIYDGSGNLLVDSSEYYDNNNMVWNIGSRNVFVYSGNNLVSSASQSYSGGSWSNNSMQHWKYDQQNRVTEWSTESAISGSWAVDEREVYSYNAAGDPDHTDYFYLVAPPVPTKIGTMYYTYTGSNLTLKYFKGTGTGDTTQMYIYHYDQYNNIDVYDHKEKQGPGWFTSRKLYYYELIWPLSVATAPFDGSVQIYPLPAAGMLNVHIMFKQPQAFTASICDMQGRTLRTWKEEATTNYTRSISTDGLPAGNYLLNINGAQNISKVFVVN